MSSSRQISAISLADVYWFSRLRSFSSIATTLKKLRLGWLRAL